MKHTRNSRLILTILIAAIIVAMLGLRLVILTSSQKTYSKLDPIIMVPGSSAGKNRFDSVIDQLNDGNSNHSVLKVVVNEDNSLSISGRIKSGDKQPFIVVAFQNNRDGYQNIKKQSRWLSVAFKQLAKKYKFNHFSAIGHSNGGVILTMFMEKYLSSSITPDALLTIASPFNLGQTTSKKTAMLKYMVAARKGLPKTLKVYSIAGTENYSGDGTVPFMSVDSGKYIFQNRVSRYTEIIVTGANTTHGDLPQNRQIINLIKQYVLKSDISERERRQIGQLPRIR